MTKPIDNEPPGRNEHLDAEALSAFLDGEAKGDLVNDRPQDSVGLAAHLEACASCHSKLNQLRAVALVLAEPTLPNTSARARAIAAALATANNAATNSETTTQLAKPPSPTLSTGLAAVISKKRKRSYSQTRLWAALGSVAAVAVAVVASVNLLPSSNDPGSIAIDAPKAADQAEQARTEGRQVAPSMKKADELGEGQAEIAADASSADLRFAGGPSEYLGEVGEPADLAALFSRRHPKPRTPTGTESMTGVGNNPGSGTRFNQAPCLTAALAVDPTRNDPLNFSATGVHAGKPVVVLGFGPAEGPITLLVFQMPECRFEYSVVVP